MDPLEVIRRWRELPAEERHRRRWASIPRSVARSMALSGEPVDPALLETEHACRAMPPIKPIPSTESAPEPHVSQEKEQA